MNCPLPKPIESFLGVKVDAVAAAGDRTLVLADDGSVYPSLHEPPALAGRCTSVNEPPFTAT
jgi:hypothetical protein